MKESQLSREQVRDHMANERTFLAWIRTSIAIMAFGFVVEKFSLFLKQIMIYFSSATKEMPQQVNTAKTVSLSYSSLLGISLVVLGAIICLLAFIKYKKIEKQINDNDYKPTIVIDVLLTLIIFIIGLLLALYLLNSTSFMLSSHF